MSNDQPQPRIPNADANRPAPRDAGFRPIGGEAEGAGESAGSSVGQSFWFAFKAIEIRLRFIAILVAIGLVIGYWDTVKNYWDKWTRPTDGGVALSASDEFYCPMHPSVVRDKPDAGGAVPKCPICGMPLSKRKKGEATKLPEGILSRVQLSPYRVELAGVKTAEAALRPLTLEVRTVGYVAVDERMLSRLVVRAAGYVEKLYVNESFAEVRQGEPLAEIYSPDLYSAAQELLIARRAKDAQLVDIAREKLRLLGVADEEIAVIERSGKADSRLVIRSPHGGHVFEKRIVEGGHVESGQMLFEVADLSNVWIEGDVFEKDAAMLKRGQAVEATVDAFPGKIFAGRVSLVHPHLNTNTRTVRVRFDVENPGHVLRPGMYATVMLKTPLQEIEPFRAMLAAQTMNLDAAGADAKVPEAAGNPAEKDDKLRPEADDALIALQKVCPVTGARLGSMGKPVRAAADGHAVYLCCAGCKDKLAARPAYYRTRLHTVSEQGVLAVPEAAVIDTGNLKIVYIERASGVFEGVAVTVGPLAGGYYPVIAGLLPGERVAAAGSFLVDAETRLNPAAAAAYFGASGTSGGGSSTAPGANGAAETAPAASSSSATEKAHAILARLPEADRQQAQQQRLCPITDLPLGSMGVPFRMVVQGKPLFLCCEGCKDKVDRDPQAALQAIRSTDVQPK